LLGLCRRLHRKRRERIAAKRKSKMTVASRVRSISLSGQGNLDDVAADASCVSTSECCNIGVAIASAAPSERTAPNAIRIAPEAVQLAEEAMHQVSLGASKLLVRQEAMYTAVPVLRIGDARSPLTVTVSAKDASAEYGVDHGGISAVTDEDMAWIMNEGCRSTKMIRTEAGLPPPGERSVTLTFAPGQRELYVKMCTLDHKAYRGLTRFYIILTASEPTRTLVAPGMLQSSKYNNATVPCSWADERGVGVLCMHSRRNTGHHRRLRHVPGTSRAPTESRNCHACVRCVVQQC
jgi:hypothetical protein